MWVLAPALHGFRYVAEAREHWFELHRALYLLLEIIVCAWRPPGAPCHACTTHIQFCQQRLQRQVVQCRREVAGPEHSCLCRCCCTAVRLAAAALCFGQDRVHFNVIAAANCCSCVSCCLVLSCIPPGNWVTQQAGHMTDMLLSSLLSWSHDTHACQ